MTDRIDPIWTTAEPTVFSRSCALPARAGIGFKPDHFAGLAEQRRSGFLEIHAENYMSAGGPALRRLDVLRHDYPLSVHGVGLSIGGETRPDPAHLARLQALLARYEHASFSEHLAWSSHGENYFNDLLPIAYDGATLARVCAHVDEVQDALGWQMLLENPSTYVEFARSTFDETDFIAEIVRRTGCALLLDVNNVAVSATNHGRSASVVLDAFPVRHVREIHLAGYAEEADSLGDPLRIDAHDSPVAEDVWALYRRAVARTGPVPTLIEWDNNVPTLDVLLAEAAKADAVLSAVDRADAA